MMRSVADIVAILRGLEQIRRLARGRAPAELITAIDRNSDVIAPPGNHAVRLLTRHARAWRLVHPGFRRQPCLYTALFAFACERRAGRAVEFNICLSTDDMRTGDGHCWLTRNGDVIDLAPKDREDFGECIGRRGPLRYWVREAVVSERRGRRGGRRGPGKGGSDA